MLKAAVVVDYQNVHLTGHELCGDTGQRPHENLLHPYYFARQLLLRRNEKAPTDLQATVEKIDVFRGLPSVDIEPNAYARNLAQQQHWHEQREVTVHHRPLQYEFHRDADGRKLRDGHGKLMATGEKREKGIDVLCAPAMVRNTLDPGIDVVILASRDSDLAPALDECHNLKSAKVESCTWVDYDRRYTLGTLKTSAKLWNTRMDRLNFEKSLDRNHYN